MAISPARAAAFDILLRVERQDAYASELLHSSQYAKLSSADHGLATELSMGVLRWRSLLDEEIERFSDKKGKKVDLEVLIALRLAAYQLMFLDRIPGRAAVHESVELVKRARKASAAPFVNAVLRKLSQSSPTYKTTGEGKARNPDSSSAASTSSAEEVSRTWAHPGWLVERWVHEFGLDTARQICIYDQHPPQIAIRVPDSATAGELAKDGIKFAPGRLLTSARRVEEGNVSMTRAFAEGRVAIQDEASQLVGLLTGRGSRILDCCAAPGGKTRVLAERNPQAGIVALELHPHRARLLRQLVPATNVEVINSDVRDYTPSSHFDCVLVDVPCSGTGTLAHNPEIKWRLQAENLADLHQRQLEILRAAMKLVEPGGRLVYSTCSMEREENDQVAEEALAAEPLFEALDCRPELEGLRTEGELAGIEIDSLLRGRFVRTIPGVHPCDGFFAAILKRKSGGTPAMVSGLQNSRPRQE
ncbi:MAG: 16S rRNA (cytosine(967)-C(5))-methyltransferase RsmB [Terriglobales bacterium]